MRAPFAHQLVRVGHAPLRAQAIQVLQVNVGKLCNQTCGHCHVDAGPRRTEIMTAEIAALCIDVLKRTKAPTLDITGGAPELNGNFRWLVEQGTALGRTVMDRCNLTVLLLPGYEDLVEFLAAHRVQVIASLPYYTDQPADAQRGLGVFSKSVQALRLLNARGYGMPGSELVLNLVYNPAGAFLPAPQPSLEADYKRELRRRHGIEFNSLYTITNMPISRFREFLDRTGNYERYMDKLANAFNPAAVAGLMCRNTLSVGWDGQLYDCDFNQMLELPIGHIRDFDALRMDRPIVIGEHCYGCTAGQGSSCGGSIT